MLNVIALIGGLGATELLIIAAVILVLFGGKRVADLGSQLGQGIKNFKDEVNRPEDALQVEDKTQEQNSVPQNVKDEDKV